MPVKKNNNYIEMELEWLDSKAAELKAYCDKRPFDKLEDRVVGKKVTANVEQQIKSLRESMMDYIKIVEAINNLREKESMKKAATRGDQVLSPLEDGKF